MARGGRIQHDHDDAYDDYEDDDYGEEDEQGSLEDDGFSGQRYLGSSAPNEEEEALVESGIEYIESILGHSTFSYEEMLAALDKCDLDAEAAVTVLVDALEKKRFQEEQRRKQQLAAENAKKEKEEKARLAKRKTVHVRRAYGDLTVEQKRILKILRRSKETPDERRRRKRIEFRKKQRQAEEERQAEEVAATAESMPRLSSEDDAKKKSEVDQLQRLVADFESSGFSASEALAAAEEQMKDQETVMPSSASKPALSLICLGHVDSGKSTLTGRVLYALGAVSTAQLRRLKKAAAEAGKGTFFLAWILDENSEERERGVTMDVAYRDVVVDKFRLRWMDAPGHRDFIPRAIAGAVSADVALVVVNCAPGGFEASWGDALQESLRGTLREHLMLCRSLGIQQILFAMNQIDRIAGVDAKRSRFISIAHQILDFLTSIGFKNGGQDAVDLFLQPDKDAERSAYLASASVVFVPCSALLGVNIVSSSVSNSNASSSTLSSSSSSAAGEDEQFGTVGRDDLSRASAEIASFYRGPSLLDCFDLFFRPVQRPSADAPLRVVVQELGVPMRNCPVVHVRVESGTMRVGDMVVTRPRNIPLRVASLGHVAIRQLSVGDLGIVTLEPIAGNFLNAPGADLEKSRGRPNNADEVGVVTGMIICAFNPRNQWCPVAHRFEVSVLTFSSEHVITRGSSLLLFLHANVVPVRVLYIVGSNRSIHGAGIQARLVLEVIESKHASASKQSGEVALEKFADCKALGRVTLRMGEITVAGGVVVDTHPVSRSQRTDGKPSSSAAPLP
eukprot:ANDGO_07964.mRNA.2 Elongation factor 1-alpha